MGNLAGGIIHIMKFGKISEHAPYAENKVETKMPDGFKNLYEPMAKIAETLGARVSYSGSVMRIEKKEPEKDFSIDLFGGCILRYKAIGYTLDEYKQFLTDLKALSFMTFFQEDTDSWVRDGKWPFKIEKELVRAFPDKNSWFP